MKEFLPSKFYLCQNYPNPFEDETKIKYCLPVKSKVYLAIFNTQGDIIEVLVNKTQQAGTYQVIYKNHKKLNGDYIYGMKAEESTVKITQIYKKAKKMLILKSFGGTS